MNGWQKAPKPYREATNKRELSFPDCNTAAVSYTHLDVYKRQVHIAAGSMEATSDRFMNPDDADATKTACVGAQAVCVSVKREKKTCLLYTSLL